MHTLNKSVENEPSVLKLTISIRLSEILSGAFLSGGLTPSKDEFSTQHKMIITETKTLASKIDKRQALYNIFSERQ